METGNTDTRNTEIARLAESGMPHSELAARFGVSRQRIGQILRTHDRHDSERTRQLKEKYSDLQKVVSRPPAKTTAIGKTVTDPDTGETVRDMSVYVAAVREQRLLTAEMRREENQEKQAEDAEQAEMMQEVLGYYTELFEENRRLRYRLARYESTDESGVVEAEIVPDAQLW